IAPVRAIGRLAAVLLLSPAEVGLLVAAAAPALDARIAPLPAAVWEPLVAASTFAPRAGVERLVRLGAIVETPALVAAPAIVGWLLGRRSVEEPSGVRLRTVPASLPPTDLSLARALVIDGRSAITRWPALLASALAVGGRTLVALELTERATRDAIARASLEARLHGGVPLIDLETWSTPDPSIARALAPIAVTLPRDPALARALEEIVAR
ncbi:MAG: hypothetical protein NT062_24150, partial [Proteobacteria bacterium]|nr:hypothetical protein [Pseudomonadota bacterium]